MRLGASPRPFWQAPLIVLALCGTLGACGTDSVESGSPASSRSSDEPAQVTSDDATGEPDARCAEVISDEVVGLLGWADRTEAVTFAGRCERTGTGDTVTVAADETVRPDGGSDVQAAYDDACQSLPTDGPGVTEQDPGWLDGATGCVVGPAEGAAAGFFEFYTLSDTGWLVHGQLAQSTDAPAADVQGAIALLVAQAQASDWA